MKTTIVSVFYNGERPSGPIEDQAVSKCGRSENGLQAKCIDFSQMRESRKNNFDTSRIAEGDKAIFQSFGLKFENGEFEGKKVVKFNSDKKFNVAYGENNGPLTNYGKIDFHIDAKTEELDVMFAKDKSSITITSRNIDGTTNTVKLSK